MDAMLGEYNDDVAFADFLADWQGVLERRVAQVIDALGTVPGVYGLILAGSVGRGDPWPLSDIDVIPVYAEEQADRAIQTIERARFELMRGWYGQGWRTGLDVGRLYFTSGEATAVRSASPVDAVTLLNDDRWYYAIDKAYKGRAAADLDGSVAQLVSWLTAQRFHQAVVAARLARTSREQTRSLLLARERAAQFDSIGAYSALLKAIQWRQIHLMELWGQRDNSLGRFGTRFAIEAERQGMGREAEWLDGLASMETGRLAERLALAPAWVIERRNRSWAARRAIGEPVTEEQNDRDVLRVSTIYALREIQTDAKEAWLAVPPKAELLDRAEMLERLSSAP